MQSYCISEHIFFRTCVRVVKQHRNCNTSAWVYHTDNRSIILMTVQCDSINNTKSLKPISNLPLWRQFYSLYSLLLFIIFSYQKRFHVLHTFFLWFALFSKCTIYLFFTLFYSPKFFFAVSLFNVLCRQVTRDRSIFFLYQLTLVVLPLKINNFNFHVLCNNHLLYKRHKQI